MLRSGVHQGSQGNTSRLFRPSRRYLAFVAGHYRISGQSELILDQRVPALRLLSMPAQGIPRRTRESVRTRRTQCLRADALGSWQHP